MKCHPLQCRINSLFYLSLFNIIIFIVFLSGCSTNETKYVIARVNNKPITLKDVENILDSKYSAAQIFQNYSLSSIKNFYSNALSNLIINILIREELENRNIEIKKDNINKELFLLYNDNFYEEYNKNNYPVNMETWLDLTKMYFQTLIFIDRIILPQIDISKEDIINYYNMHQQQFTIPESWELFIVSSHNKEMIEKFCQDIKNNMNQPNKNLFFYTQYVMDNEGFESYTISDNLKKGFCAPVIKKNDQWLTIIPKEKYLPQKKALVEVYGLIENILKRNSIESEFNKWLEFKLQNSKIEITPHLKDNFIE